MWIGQLAEQVGVNPKTIRFYEAEGLLPQPRRTSTGYREYGPDDRQRVIFIKSAQRLGMSLDEIAEILAFRDRGGPPCAYVRQVLVDQVTTIDQRIAKLVRLRDQLLELPADTEKPPRTGGYSPIVDTPPDQT